jgi:hypothetical protein
MLIGDGIDGCSRRRFGGDFAAHTDCDQELDHTG